MIIVIQIEPWLCLLYTVVTMYEGISEVEWAQFATWVDSDGCISIGKSEPRPSARQKTAQYQAKIQVANTDLRIMQWLKERFRGEVGSQRPASGNCKARFYWQSYADDLVPLLKGILPYLLLKKQQALCVIAFRTEALWKRGGNKQTPPPELARREVLYQTIKSLNKRGPREND